MAQIQNIKIQLRKDQLSNWTSANPILRDGEIAIAIDEEGLENLKIGNGISSFTQLPFLYQSNLKTDLVSAKEVTAKSISQGYNVHSTPTSLATGIFTEASANFGVVHGIEAQIKPTDDYAFVFNGENLPGINERYFSHGEGSFNVNPLSGLNGFYIGEESLSSIFNHYFLSSEISNYYDKTQVNSLYFDLDNKIIAVDNKLSDYYTKNDTSSAVEISNALEEKIKIGQYSNNEYDLKSADISVVKIAADDYYRLVSEEKTISDIVYIVSSDNVNAHGQTIINVASPILSDDAATKNYVDNAVSGIDLTEYYKKSETSSAVEISTSLDKKIKIGSYQDSEYDLKSSDLSVIKISEDDYIDLVAKGQINQDAVYITSADYLNAYNKQIKNVANPLSSTDAANKQYVDNSLIGRLLSTDLSFSYDSTNKKINLNAFNGRIGQVDCADFIKDGMLSSVQLCGNVLIFKFNTDAGITPISVNLSSFVDNYDEKIAALSSSVSALSDEVNYIASDYLDSNDKIDILNRCLEPHEVKLYKGPGTKDITLSVGSGATLCAYTATLSDFYSNSETSSAIEISSALNKKISIGNYSNGDYSLSSNDLSIVKIAADDYYRLVSEEKIISSVVYILSSDNINAHGQTIINVASPILSDDAATKNYVDDVSVILSNAIPTKVSQLANDIGYISVHQSLSDYYQKNETSSANQISIAFDNKIKIGSYSNSVYSLSSNDLSIIKIAEDDYIDLVAKGKIDQNAVYITSADYLNAYNKQIKNVASPLSSTDAANKQYVDDALSRIDLSDYYKKNETSSSTEISTALDKTAKINVGWHGEDLKNVKELSIINITRDQYYNLVDQKALISGAQYIISNDTYLNWPARICIDFLDSSEAGQEEIVSCINSFISVFNHANLDGNQLMRLVTIENLSSSTASQEDIVRTVNSILSAYKNQLEPYTVIEKGKLNDYYTKSETSSAVEISTALKNIDLSECVKENELSIFTLSSNNTINLKVKNTVISASIPESSTTILRVWNS